ncbi:MAG: hypothetical protein P4M11_09060, partial [Candidatus Pacebacteria bacterium]|nr:hypothetical protein [Candidatus Paceibacterota bacterium]
MAKDGDQHEDGHRQDPRHSQYSPHHAPRQQSRAPQDSKYLQSYLVNSPAPLSSSYFNFSIHLARLYVKAAGVLGFWGFGVL